MQEAVEANDVQRVVILLRNGQGVNAVLQVQSANSHLVRSVLCAGSGMCLLNVAVIIVYTLSVPQGTLLHSPGRKNGLAVSGFERPPGRGGGATGEWRQVRGHGRGERVVLLGPYTLALVNSGILLMLTGAMQ